MRLVTLSKWFIAIAVMVLVSMPPQSHSGQREDKIAASCTVSSGGNVYTGMLCYGQGVFIQEMQTCLTGGDCLGDSNDLLGCNGFLLHNIFGRRCQDSRGPGVITIVNNNPYTIRFRVASPTGPEDIVDIGPNNFWVTPYTYVNYLMNFPNGSNDATRYSYEGNRLHNGYSYRLVGSQAEPRLACAQSHNSAINDQADPCN